MAVFFWITIWQFASMYLGQEILLASPVSVVRKLFELSFTGNFWQSVGFSFVRIVTGFLLAMFLGIFLAVLAYWSKTVEILIAPVIAVVKSTPVASFIILCLIWIPPRNLSVFISFLMVLPVIYTNILEGIRQTDRKILEMAKVFQVNPGRKIRYIYVSQILRDLCCVFLEGKTTCIRGRSGCGKTTLIRLLLGLDIPDKGKIEGISDRKISAVFQEDRLCENLSAASNIRLVCTETIDYILKKTEGKTLIFVTHEEQEAVWLKADKTLKFMKDHLIK